MQKLSIFKRELASKKLENDINNELNPLRLINASFKVDINAKEKKLEYEWIRIGQVFSAIK